MDNLLSYLIAGTLGVLLQVLAVKIPRTKARYKVANQHFSVKEYFADDWPAILASFVSVLILIVGLDELLKIRPILADYVRWLFIFVGFTGSTIILSVLSVADKKIMQIIDIKTNIADGIKPAVDDSNKVGAKAMKQSDQPLDGKN